MNSQNVITFKPTSTTLQAYKHAYNAAETIEQIKELLCEYYSTQYNKIKLIYKGKILNDHLTAEQAQIANAIVMVVINNKTQKPKQNVGDQTLPKVPSAFNTGMGSTSPIGFGGYSLINHPQYMSAISGAVNEEKLQQMMDDPTYQGMMEEMMNDPQTMKQLIQENPMLKNMMNQNPMMKSMMENPAMMKMVFNPETMKMAKEYMKNGGQTNLSSTLSSQNPQNINQQQQNPQQQNPQQPNPFMMGFPMNSMNQMGNQMGNPMGNPMMGNPFGMNMGMNPWMMQNQGQQKKEETVEQKYKNQLKELELMGFKDKERNLIALMESKGDVDGALEYLCKD